MEQPLLLLAAIAALGLVYVILPVTAEAYFRYRKSHSLICPEDERAASVQIDAKKAAWHAATDGGRLRVRACSLWPEKSGCSQRCVAQLS